MRVFLEFFLTPIPKGRPRFARRGKFVKTYNPVKTANFEAAVKMFAAMQMKKQNKNKLVGPLLVCVLFEFQRPKKTSLFAPRKDVDNLCKSTFDALNGVLYLDDTQIVEMFARKKWSTRDMITVMAEELNEGQK